MSLKSQVSKYILSKVLHKLLSSLLILLILQKPKVIIIYSFQILSSMAVVASTNTNISASKRVLLFLIGQNSKFFDIKT